MDALASHDAATLEVLRPAPRASVRAPAALRHATTPDRRAGRASACGGGDQQFLIFQIGSQFHQEGAMSGAVELWATAPEEL